MAKYTLTNLLTNPSFENTGWAASSSASISYNSSIKRSGSYGLQVNSTSSSETLIVTSDTLPLIDEHIYYCSVYLYETSAVCSSMQVYWPIAEPFWGVCNTDSTKLNQWQRMSWRVIRSNWSNGNYQFRFDFEGMAANTTVYIDDAVLIDLTAIFGSGNEPSLDWCNANIEYFEGTVEKNFKLPSIYDLTQTIPSKIKTGDILNCPYSGTTISITLPKGQYKLECWGAQGGSSTYHGTAGGKGGYSTGIYTINKATTLYLNVGGMGNTGSYAVYGGWNGGGGVTNSYNSGGTGNHLGSGGGASDISTVAGTCSLDSYYRYVRSAASYAGRIIVAAGGGGAEGLAGTAGGGTTGVNDSYGSYAGTQSAAGSFSYGSSSSDTWVDMYAGGLGYGVSTTGGHTSHAMGSCGGGGYYGGGAYGYNGSYAHGYGGSGYVSSILSSSSMSSGLQSGHGKIVITVIKAGEEQYIKQNNTWKPISKTYKKVLYERLEYIASSGTQFIDTNFYPNANSKIELEFNLLSSTGTWLGIVGCRGTNLANCFSLFVAGASNSSPNKFYPNIGGSSNVSLITPTKTLVGPHTVILDRNICTIDGTAYTFVASGQSLFPAYLFAVNDAGSASLLSSIQISSCKIYDNNVLVRDYIPVKQNLTNELGLYDLINNKFYTNKGTSSFTAGPETGETVSGWVEIEDTYSEINNSDKKFKFNRIWNKYEVINVDDPNTLLLIHGEENNTNNENYIKPEMKSSSFLLINNLSDIQTANGYTGSILSNIGVTESTDVPANTSFTKSLYFNGSSYITFNNYDFMANDFTIEWWEKPTSVNAGTRFMSTFGTSGGTEAGIMLGWWCTSDVIPEIKWTSNDSYSSWNVIGHGISAGNTDTTMWHHMAYVRAGSNFTIFMDGVALNTVNVSNLEIGCNMSLPMCFGRRGSDTANGNLYSGYLCGIRLSNKALYTNFGSSDKIIDSSAFQVPITNAGVVLSNTQAKIGTKSLYFNGSSQMTLNNLNLIPKNSNFTMEWWEYRTSSAADSAIFHQNNSSESGYGFLTGYGSANNLYISSGTNNWSIASAVSMGPATLNQWVHYAIVRNGSSFLLFRNGTLYTSFSSSAAIANFTINPTMGCYNYNNSDYYFTGYVDEFRISNIARWTSNFTPPTEPYKASGLGPGDFIEQVESNIFDAYPLNGVQDGYYYVKAL